jgi:hypothetical protein
MKIKKSDIIAADISLYAMKQIQMAKFDREATGETDYWDGEIMSMRYLLLHIDKLIGKKETNDRDLPDLKLLFDRVGHKRKDSFIFFWSRIWEDELED